MYMDLGVQIFFLPVYLPFNIGNGIQDHALKVGTVHALVYMYCGDEPRLAQFISTTMVV